MRIVAVFLLSSMVALPGLASDPPTAGALLDRSLAHHDPGGVWDSRPLELEIEVELAPKLAEARGYQRRTDRLKIDNASGRFHYTSDKGDDRLEILAEQDRFTARLNGSAEMTAAEREHHRLAEEQLPSWRDYMVYMYGIPMKLRDPGTRLDPEIRRTEFNGRQVLTLRVTYAPEVGKDIWYFYFDRDSYALVGCRFFHDESANDGEYLIFEGEVEGPDRLRLPRVRRWYMNADDLYIATDDLLSIR